MIEYIMERLECSELYAKKMIVLCEFDPEEVVRTVGDKLDEKARREAVVVYAG